MSQDQNKAIIRNQVKWRQDSVAIDFTGREKNVDNIRNIVAIRTNQTCCHDIKTGARHKFEEARQKHCRDTIVNIATYIPVTKLKIVTT